MVRLRDYMWIQSCSRDVEWKVVTVAVVVGVAERSDPIHSNPFTTITVLSIQKRRQSIAVDDAQGYFTQYLVDLRAYTSSRAEEWPSGGGWW